MPPQATLSTRFSFSDEPLKQVLVDAFNANTAVMAYTNAIQLTDLTVLPGKPPSWWATLLNDFPTVKEHAGVWGNEIMADLHDIPKALVDYSTLFLERADEAISDAQTLQGNPGDSGALGDLTGKVSDMLTRLQQNKSSLGELTTKIDEFAANLTSDLDTLQKAVTSAEQSQGVDLATVNDLKTKVGELEAKIQTYTEQLEVAEIGIGVSIFIGVIGIALIPVSGGASAVLIGVGVAGLGGSIAGTVVLHHDIEETQAEITQDQLTAEELTKQALALVGVAHSMQQLSEKAAAASTAVTAIEKACGDLADSLGAVVAELEKATTDETAANYVAVVSDLEAAKTDWATVKTDAEDMADIKYVPATEITPIATSSV
jgi:hypothetical protein